MTVLPVVTVVIVVTFVTVVTAVKQKFSQIFFKNLLQNSNTQIVTKLKNTNGDNTGKLKL